MRFSRLIAGASTLALAAPSFAQISFNELYVSHTGTDDHEFVELIGPVGTDLTGHVLCVVEGDSSNPGTLDQAIDLSGNTISTGYFVVGNTAVANLDLDVGASNVFENGTETFYLIQTNDVAAIQALLGTDLDVDGDLITDLATMGTIIDIVALTDGGAGDETFDGAMVLGPDGSFLPAGIFRGDDAPNPWCGTFLDFNLGTDRTPGAQNISCPVSGPTAYCAPANANSVSATGGVLTSTGGYGTASATFDITDVPNQPGLLYSGPNQIDLPFGCGRRCVGGTITRGSIVVPSGNVALGVSFDMSLATTLNIQYWFRDPANLAACGDAFNLSNALMP